MAKLMQAQNDHQRHRVGQSLEKEVGVSLQGCFGDPGDKSPDHRRGEERSDKQPQRNHRTCEFFGPRGGVSCFAFWVEH